MSITKSIKILKSEIKTKEIRKKKSSKVSRPFLNYKKKDIQVFLFCLSAAAFLWFFNALSKTRTVSLSYPIEFEYDKNKYIALKALPEAITVNMTGSGWQLLRQILRIRIKSARYVIQRPIYRDKPYILGSHLKRNIIKAVRDVQVGEIFTDTIPIVMDKIYQQKLQLKVDSSWIKLQKNYRLTGKIKIEPSEIVCEGPEKMLKALPHPFILSIPEKDIASDYDESIEINLGKNQQKLIKLEPSRVSIKFKVAEFTTYKTNLPVYISNFPKKSNFHLPKESRQVEIFYSFQKKNLGKIRLGDFRLVADFNTFDEADSTLLLSLKTKPQWIQKEDIKMPSRVKLIYEK